MDIVNVIGVGSYSFEDEKTGRQISGFKFHCTSRPPANNPSFLGEQVMTFSASTKLAENWAEDGIKFPQVGGRYYVYYNRYGKLDYMAPVELDGKTAEKK